MATLPQPEALQPYILHSLAISSTGSIPDSRQLEYNGVKLESGEEQGVVKSVLDSLASKEVCPCSRFVEIFYFLMQGRW